MNETSKFITRPRTLALLAALAATTLMGVSAAQAQEAPPVNSGKVSFTAGFDVVTEYWFRGLGQENQGLIFQPYVDATFLLVESDDYALTGSLGTWNSLHDNNSGDAWYESDFYAGINAQMGPLGVGFGYTNLYNPAGGDIFAEEIYGSVSYDDSALWDGDFALNPTVTVVVEIDGGSDNGTNKGEYLEVALEPGFADIFGSDTMPVDLAVPMTVGINIDNYYEDGMGNDDDFGFFDIGTMLSTPLDSLIPADYGAWTASVGVHVIFLGDSAENISGTFGTGNNSSSVYGTFGISMEY